MPLPRFDKLSPDKRRAILAAAAAEFAAHGFEEASFNRIIAAAGISKGAMYYYFADKADAYGAVIDDVFDQVAEALSDLARPRTAAGFWDTMAAGLDRLGETFFADRELAALARGLYQRSGSPVYQRLVARESERVEALLALGQGLGAVREDLPRDLLTQATVGLLVAIDRWFADAYERLDPEELMPLFPKTLELVRDLLDAERRPS